jgi:hypothetical protein
MPCAGPVALAETEAAAERAGAGASQDDVAGIDVNMGCPKPFSLHVRSALSRHARVLVCNTLTHDMAPRVPACDQGGMGAALLSQPAKVHEVPLAPRPRTPHSPTHTHTHTHTRAHLPMVVSDP